MSSDDPTPAPYQDHVVVPGVFSAAECRRIIDVGAACGAEPAALESSADEEQSTLDGAVRSSQVAWIPRDASTEWIHTALEDVAERANQQYRFELTGIEEHLQFTVYDHPGAFYTWHQDGLDTGVEHRKLSLVVQLSAPSDYGGATLEFFALSEDGTDAERAAAARSVSRRGTVVAFPSFEYHRVTPLQWGVRHSLVAWVAGPAFR